MLDFVSGLLAVALFAGVVVFAMLQIANAAFLPVVGL